MHRLCSTVYTYCERIYLSEKFFIILLICCHQLKPVVLVNRWWSIWWNAELMGLQYVWNRWGFDISQYKIFWTYPGNLSTHKTARCYKVQQTQTEKEVWRVCSSTTRTAMPWSDYRKPREPSSHGDTLPLQWDQAPLGRADLFPPGCV